MRFFKLLPVVCLVAVALPATVSRASGGITVHDTQVAMDKLNPAGSCKQGRATTISCKQPDTQIEPSIAVNPQNANNAVAAYQEGRVDGGGAADNGWATTFDGGRTWKYGDVPKLTKAVGGTWELASDAAVAFGPNNTVYINSLVIGTAGFAGLTVNVSHDGGLHWSNPYEIVNDGDSSDKNWIVVDNQDLPGHHYGRVYVVWDRIAPVVAAYSDDDGKTWQTGKYGFVVYPGQGIASIPIVLNNGDLAVVYSSVSHPAPVVHWPPTHIEENEALAGDHLSIAIARGAGSILTGAPLVFEPPISAAAQDITGQRGQRAGGFPAVDVDRRTGRIYVAWNDARFRRDRLTDIVVTWSDDGGLTWSPVERVNTGRGDDQVDRWCAMLGVGEDGTVHIAYRVRKESTSDQPTQFSKTVETYYQQSTNGGLSFSHPMRVDQAHSDMGYGAVSRGGVFLGDYDQLAVGSDSHGDHVYIVRAEPVAGGKGEFGFFTPVYHHQRAWVATVLSS